MNDTNKAKLNVINELFSTITNYYDGDIPDEINHAFAEQFASVEQDLYEYDMENYLDYVDYSYEEDPIILDYTDGY